MLFGDMSDRMHLDQFRHVFLKIVQKQMLSTESGSFTLIFNVCIYI